MKISIADCYVVAYYNWDGNITSVDEAFMGPDAKAEAEAEVARRLVSDSKIDNLGMPLPAYHVLNLDDYISEIRTYGT